MKAFVRNEGEGEKLWFHGGGVHEWKLTPDESGGTIGMFEDTLERGKSTPLHHHPDSGELVYVLEGELLTHAEGGPCSVGKGGVLFHPRGAPHGFVVTSESARILLIITPATRVAAFYRQASTPGESGAVDFARVGAAAKDMGATVIMGPLPFAKR